LKIASKKGGGKMLTELQKRKLTALFNHEDMNKEGFYERADAEEFVRRICVVLGFAPGSPEAERVRASTSASRQQEALKEFYQKKGNRESLEDYLELCDLIINDEKLLTQLGTGYAHLMFELWDQNKDGKLSADEFVKLEWCYGVGEDAAREAFRKLDRNGDGYLTIEEGTQAAREFYLSDDPAAPGNWLFGPY
jgi:Ca2+-binding EF-hand superfamily protein